MALIKNANAHTAARHAVVLDLGDLKRQGDLLKQSARAEAERIIVDARRRRDELIAGAAEEGRRAGHAEGFEQGRAEGHAQGLAQALESRRESLDAATDAWLKVIDAFEAQREHLFVESRLDVIRLALRLAEKVIKRSIQADPQVAESQLEAVLSLLSNRARMVVAIHPDDEQTIRDAMPRLMNRFSGAAHVELVPDASLQRGSVVARTEAGAVVDASIDTQLERLADALLPGAGPA